MPTGYTAELMEKGMKFEDFVLNCARAFGACISLRDENISKAPRKIKEDSYHKKELDNAIKELAKWNKLTKKQKTGIVEKERIEAIKDAKKYQKKNEDENDRLIIMKANVLDWTPPTPEHVNLKNFMLEQIDTSMHIPDYYDKEIKEWEGYTTAYLIKNRTDDYIRDVEYHRKELEKEIGRNNGNNDWLEQLYKSLGK